MTAAKIQGADLTSAKLLGANLTSANLQGADSDSANLQRADLTWSKLQGADLTEVEVWRASFPVDLTDKSHVLFGVPKTKISPPTERDRTEFRQDLKSKVTDGKLLKGPLDRLNQWEEPGQDGYKWSAFIKSRAKEPPPTDTDIERVLFNLACGDQYIATGMAQRTVTHSDDGSGRDYAELLGKALLREDCKGARH